VVVGLRTWGYPVLPSCVLIEQEMELKRVILEIAQPPFRAALN